MEKKRRIQWLEEFYAGRGGGGVPGGMPPQGGILPKPLPATACAHRRRRNTIATKSTPSPSPTPTTPTAPPSPSLYPPEILSAFEHDILERSMGDWDGTGVCPPNVKRLKNAWTWAQRFLNDTQKTPFELALVPNVFADYCASHALSLDYTTKILAVINKFGIYLEYRHNPERRRFQLVPPPRGAARERIREAFRQSSGGGRASLPLTRNMLAKARKHLTPAEYDWLYVSFYLGLRPSEVDALGTLGAPGGKPFYSIVERKGIRWLRVYQPKLTSVAPEKRWKAVPLVYPSQKKAVRLASTGGLKRPSVFKLKRIFNGRQVTTYAGRKGYAPMMLDKGVSFAAISKLLGHKTEKLTRAVYSDALEVQMEELSNLIGKKGEE